jgi:transposase
MRWCGELGVLLPHLAGAVIDEVVAAGGLLPVLARARAGTAQCPACGVVSAWVHSRYGRQLADAAIGGRRVVIQLAVRRFFCPAPAASARRSPSRSRA